MNSLKILQRIKTLYEENHNIIEYLRSIEGREENTIEDILISYDFQAGSYVQGYKNNIQMKEQYCRELARVLNSLGLFDSLLEAGIGEATTLAPLLNKLHNVPKGIVGFDLSWSRIKYAKKFLNETGYNDCLLTTGDLLAIPIKNCAIDVVYTSHSIEPNGGKEREILKELYRVSKKYLVLFEPAFELAGEEARQRMIKHGYVTNLYQSAKDLGYSILDYKLLDFSINSMNPTGVMIIEKKLNEEVEFNNEDTILSCPLTQTSLIKKDNVLFTPRGLLAYPIIQDIPCLLPNNAIIATKFLED